MSVEWTEATEAKRNLSSRLLGLCDDLVFTTMSG